MTAPVEQMYVQVHEHLRESNRKRDQIAAFYVALLAGIFAGWKDLPTLLVTALGAACLLGFAFSFILLRYRCWHIKYAKALIVFQVLLSSTEKVDLKRCKELWDGLIDTRWGWRLANPFSGVESATYTGFTVVVGVPVHLLVQQLNMGFAPWFGGELTALIVNVLLVVVVGYLFAAWFLPSAETFPSNNWMFGWLVLSNK